MVFGEGVKKKKARCKAGLSLVSELQINSNQLFLALSVSNLIMVDPYLHLILHGQFLLLDNSFLKFFVFVEERPALEFLQFRFIALVPLNQLTKFLVVLDQILLDIHVIHRH